MKGEVVKVEGNLFLSKIHEQRPPLLLLLPLLVNRMPKLEIKVTHKSDSLNKQG